MRELLSTDRERMYEIINRYKRSEAGKETARIYMRKWRRRQKEKVA